MGDKPSDPARHCVDAPFPRPSPALEALLVSRNQGHLVRGHRPVVIAEGSEGKRAQLVFQAHVRAASGPEAVCGVLPGRRRSEHRPQRIGCSTSDSHTVFPERQAALDEQPTSWGW